MPDGNIDTAAQEVTLSDSAVERLKVLGAEAEHAGQMLRVAV
ncbi:unnamed protein product, partial [Discosporangium mesarthrocarpum]